MNIPYGVVTLNDNVTIALHSPGGSTQYVTVCNVYQLCYHKLVEKSRIKKQNALGYLKRPKIRFLGDRDLVGLPKSRAEGARNFWGFGVLYKNPPCFRPLGNKGGFLINNYTDPEESNIDLR